MLQEFQIVSYAESCMAARVCLGSSYLTGHHMIPDHCFYISPGGRAAQVSQLRLLGTASYRTDDAPVIMLTADKNGGKSQHHGDVHAYFDPIEKYHFESGNNTWTYEQVSQLAIDSVGTLFGSAGEGLSVFSGTIRKALDNYYISTIGLKNDSLLRCGEAANLGSEFAEEQPRRSSRFQ